MRPTDALREDHRAIRLMLGILESICGKLQSGAAVEPEDLDVILAFIRSFVGPHQTLGENLVPTIVVRGDVPDQMIAYARDKLLGVLARASMPVLAAELRLDRRANAASERPNMPR